MFTFFNEACMVHVREIYVSQNVPGGDSDASGSDSDECRNLIKVIQEAGKKMMVIGELPLSLFKLCVLQVRRCMKSRTTDAYKSLLLPDRVVDLVSFGSLAERIVYNVVSADH